MSHQRRPTRLTFNRGIFLISFFILILSAVNTVQASQPDAEVLLAQATLAYDQQQYDKALALLLDAKKQDSKNSRVYYYLGLVYLARQEPEKAVPHLERGVQLQPSDVYARYQLGTAYFAVRDYDKAEPLLLEVYEQQPQLDSLGFYVGYLRYRKKDYQGALTAFEGAQTDDPETQQLAQFYRGMTLGILGLPQQAIQELEQVQQNRAVSPLTSAAIRIRDNLASQRIVDEKNPLRLQLSVGGFYDDNVRINPDPVGTIPSPNQNQFIDDLRSRSTPSPGFLTSLLAEYSFFRQGPWEGIATGSFFQTVNTNDGLSELNIREFLGGLGGYYRGEVWQLPYQLGLHYSFSYVFLEDDPFLMRNRPTLTGAIVGPSFTLPYIGNINNLTTVLYRFEYKTFFGELGDHNSNFRREIRDGHNNMIGFLHAFRFLQDTALLRIGYQYDSENTDGAAFGYTGNRFITGGQVILPWGSVKLNYEYDVHWRAYKRPQSLFTDRDGDFVQRNDIQHTHVVQIVKPLPYSLSVMAQYQGIRNSSRIPLYDYKKNVFSLIVTWTY